MGDRHPWNFPRRREIAAQVTLKALLLTSALPVGAAAGATYLPLKTFVVMVGETWQEELMHSRGDAVHAARHTIVMGGMVIILSPGISLIGALIGAGNGALIVLDAKTRKKVTPDLHEFVRRTLFALTTPNLG